MFSKIIEYTEWENIAQEGFQLLLDWNNNRAEETEHMLLEVVESCIFHTFMEHTLSLEAILG